MKDSLKPTLYCDHDNPEIQAVAAKLRAGDTDPVAIARRTFYFVRDGFALRADLYARKASETLKRGHGACWNESLLLIALLRCNEIPARFGSVPLKRSFFNPAVGAWHRFFNNPFNHCMVHAYLNDRWTILDAAMDKGTYESIFRPSGVEWGIDWNGRDDVKIYTESILGPPVTHPDIDAAITEKVGNVELPRPLAVIGNRIFNRKIGKRAGARFSTCTENAAPHL